MVTKFPCKDCLVLPLCKAKVRNRFGIYSILAKRCELFKVYCQATGISIDKRKSIVIKTFRIYPEERI